MGDGGLDVAEVGGDRKERRESTTCQAWSRLPLTSKDRAAAALLLPAGQFVLGVGRQAG